MKALSILTLNVWNREGPWQKRLSLLRDSIAQQNPDLIGFTEVLDSNHVAELLPNTEYHIEWMGAHSGIAIVSRWPIVERRECWLRGDNADNVTVETAGGMALRGLVQSPFGVIPFTCAASFFYMTHHGYKREQQMPGLNEFARGTSREQLPAILVGDFNTDPDSAEIRYLKGLQSLQGGSAYWCDAWEHGGDGTRGTTWSRDNGFAAWAPWPNRRIDYIFVAQPRLDHVGTIRSCEVVCNRAVDGVWPSDHFGVFATIQASA